MVRNGAVAMVFVFAIFGTHLVDDFEQMGLGLAFAVLLDATLIRGVLLPASMKLLGEWNWWASRRSTGSPRSSHEGEAVPRVRVGPDRHHPKHPGARLPGGRRSWRGWSPMRRIGLLGGTSWESSAEYYRLVNQEVRDRLGELHSADCLLRSVDFACVERLQRDGRWDDAADLLAAEALALEQAGAELMVLCTNTMHKVAGGDHRRDRNPLRAHRRRHGGGCPGGGPGHASGCWPPPTRWSRTSTSAGCATSTASR